MMRPAGTKRSKAKTSGTATECATIDRRCAGLGSLEFLGLGAFKAASLQCTDLDRTPGRRKALFLTLRQRHRSVSGSSVRVSPGVRAGDAGEHSSRRWTEVRCPRLPGRGLGATG